MTLNNWYVITGGPSVGKTTLLAELEKLGHLTVPEAARLVIDRGIAKGLSIDEIRRDEKQFQEEIARVKEEIEKSLRQDVLTFLDRGMHDTIAYLKLGSHKIENWVHELISQASYRKVFILEPLPVYESDYARIETDTERLQLNQLLGEAYRSAGMEVVNVPVMSPVKRAQFVLSQITADSTETEQIRR